MAQPFPPHERNLFVIESPEKIHRVKSLLGKAGFSNFRVEATSGLLFDLPPDAIAINPISLLVTGYMVRRREDASQIRDLASRADRVFVMTDADREGEMIAAQVLQLCSGKPVIRLRMRSLTLDALNDALASAGEIDMGAATASTARRILDRIIGYGFSDTNQPQTGIVGRVSTAALAAFASNPVACGEWTGKIGAFNARGTITNRSIEDARRISVLMHHAGHEIEKLPRERLRKLIKPPRPCNCSDAILEGRRRLGISTREAEKVLQSAYKGGRLSYIRSDSTHLGPSARVLAVKLAKDARLMIAANLDNLHQIPTTRVGRKYAHEALHPTSPIDVDLPPSLQSQEDGLLTLIGRRLAMSVAAPVEIEREQVVPGALRQFLLDRLGESAAEVDLQLIRDITPPATWMQWLKRTESMGIPQIETFGADATALSFLAGSNFGRPSNQIYLVDSMIRKGWIDEIGNVTPLGRRALEYAREHAPFLLDYSLIDKVEQVLDQNDGATVPKLLGQLCNVMGLPLQMAQAAVSNWYLAKKQPLPESPIPRPRTLNVPRATNPTPTRSTDGFVQ